MIKSFLDKLKIFLQTLRERFFKLQSTHDYLRNIDMKLIKCDRLQRYPFLLTYWIWRKIHLCFGSLNFSQLFYLTLRLNILTGPIVSCFQFFFNIKPENATLNLCQWDNVSFWQGLGFPVSEFSAWMSNLKNTTLRFGFLNLSQLFSHWHSEST